MITTRMLVRTLVTGVAAAVVAFGIVMVDRSGTLPAGTTHPDAPDAITGTQLAASSLDNAREGDGTLYGYRV